MLGAEQDVQKLNKSAELMLNASSQQVVGKKVTEILGANNGHLIETITQLSSTKPMASKLKTVVTTR